MTPLDWSILLTALSALIATLINGTKTKAEVREINARLIHETSPNTGTSLKDATNRIEGAIKEMKSNQRGMARDIGRLADADHIIITEKTSSHGIIHRRIDGVVAAIEELSKDKEK